METITLTREDVFAALENYISAKVYKHTQAVQIRSNDNAAIMSEGQICLSVKLNPVAPNQRSAVLGNQEAAKRLSIALLRLARTKQAGKSRDTVFVSTQHILQLVKTELELSVDGQWLCKFVRCQRDNLPEMELKSSGKARGWSVAVGVE